ncbi:MAG: HPr kinase/phosphatase C-terminal domain-containing protein, partial [Alphaproteobacteria bacterium]|nr:HPr kinase/phosphatase C-terminal domain-containing protein [Alphaproteobacteria bacterium]
VVQEGRAVLLRGPSGSGKSDLALRLIDEGAELLGDDYVRLEMHEGTLVARPAEAIAGLLEVRGLGLVRLPYVDRAPLALVVDLVPPEHIERLPEPATTTLAGFNGFVLPHLKLSPFEASASAKLRLALRGLGADMIGP